MILITFLLSVVTLITLIKVGRKEPTACIGNTGARRLFNPMIRYTAGEP